MNVNDLPIEVLGNQIFKYFSFSRWLDTLSLVCQSWHDAATRSNALKSLYVSIDTIDHRIQCRRILKKFKVDSLVLSHTTDSLATLRSIIEASPRLNKLAIGISRRLSGFEFAKSTKNDATIVPPVQFNNLTTLLIPTGHLSLLQLFPSVKYLTLNADFIEHQKEFKNTTLTCPSVKELEISIQRHELDFDCLKRVFPSITKLYICNLNESKKKTQIWSDLEMRGKLLNIEVVCRFPHVNRDSFDLSSISYWHYAMSYKETPLYHCLHRGNAEQIQKLLETKTSGAYEHDLNRRDVEFIFPTLIGFFEINYSFYMTAVNHLLENSYIDYSDTVDILLAHNVVSYWEALIHFINQEKTDRILKLLHESSRHIHEKIPSDIYRLVALDSIEATMLKECMGEQTFKFLFNQTLTLGQTFLHWYAHRGSFIDLEPYKDLIDWNVLNKHGENAATVAFNNNYFDIWAQLVKLGSQIQFEAYTDQELSRLIRFSDIPALECLDILRTCPQMPPSIFIAALPYLETGRERREDLRFFENSLEIFQEGIDCCDQHGQSLFNYVLQKTKFPDGSTSNASLLEHLLNKHKIDINHVDKAGNTPLITAILSNEMEKVQFVLENGANPNLAGNSLLPINLTLLQLNFVSLPLVIDILLYYGADINAVDFDTSGRQITPLALAFMNGLSLDTIKFMKSRGANLRWIDDAGNTLLHLVLLHNNVEYVQPMVEWLSRYIDINRPNKCNETPIHCAILGGGPNSIIEAYIDCGADISITGGLLNQSCLSMAVQHALTALKSLAKSDRSIDLKHSDKFGKSFVYYTLNCTSTSVLTKLCAEIKKIIDGTPTPAILTLFTSHVLLTRFFIESVGYDVNIKAQDGSTLISSFNTKKNFTPDVVDYLIKNGADVNIQDHHGNTPLMRALARGPLTAAQCHYCHVLLRHGAAVTIKNKDGVAPIDIDPKIARTDARGLDGECLCRADSLAAAVNLTELRKKKYPIMKYLL